MEAILVILLLTIVLAAAGVALAVYAFAIEGPGRKAIAAFFSVCLLLLAMFGFFGVLASSLPPL